MINFCYDKLSTPTVGYPNLAKWTAQPYTPEWRQFDKHWPRTVPLRLLMYLDAAHIPYGVYTVKDAPVGSWYPISISWFDFSCNYFSLLSNELITRVANSDIKLLFYYHEGDNPRRIVEYLNQARDQMSLPSNCYHFISANSAADSIACSTYFSEHEFFFRYVNRKQRLLDNCTTRDYEFTALNRTHKWWRAAVMTDLQSHGILDNSLWSYNSVYLDQDDYKENPIEVDIFDNDWRENMHKFVSEGPYQCDQLDNHQQNDHHYVNTDLYTKSFFHIVIETHFDADQSGGAFLTEKIWKPIKFGQPFVVIGPVGTLSALRKEGYNVFDHVLDNSYDAIEDNTQRYIALRNLLIDMQHKGVSDLFSCCLDEIQYNQQLFALRTIGPLNSLIEKLQCQI